MRNSRRVLSALLCVIFVMLSAAEADATRRTIKPRKGMNLTGRVTVDGKPRKGVVVSDGINVVTTDRKGEYQMATSGRQHVFVSLPADCKVPLGENGMPEFYRTIADGNPGQIDFELESQPVKTNWKLFTVADPQIGVQDTADFASIVIPQMQEFVSTLGPNAYGFSLGDLVWNCPQLYPEYVRRTASVGIPMFSVIGNHDHNQHIKNDTESDRDFRDALGPTYYSVNIGDCHLVALDDIFYRGEKHRNDYSGYITPQQLDWLRQDLAAVDTSKTIIVGMHIPTKRRNAPWVVDNADSLYALLRPFHSAEILTGHTHYQITTDIEPGITETTFAAAMGAFWYPLCADGSPRGFAVLEFDGPRLKDKYYVGGGCPRDYQMKIYAPDDAVLWNPEVEPGTPYDKILINIFCWHTDWTVEVSEDGGDFILLGEDDRLIPEKVGGKCWDPEVRKCLVKDNRIPSHHGGSHPQNNNDHMFLYRPAQDSWQSITVRATDPYGNVYTDTLQRK